MDLPEAIVKASENVFYALIIAAFVRGCMH